MKRLIDLKKDHSINVYSQEFDKMAGIYYAATVDGKYAWLLPIQVTFDDCLYEISYKK